MTSSTKTLVTRSCGALLAISCTLTIRFALLCKFQGRNEELFVSNPFPQPNFTYTPASSEQYIIDHEGVDEESIGCLNMNKDPAVKDVLQVWKKELEKYYSLIDEQQEKELPPDVRTLFNERNSNKAEICSEYSDVARHTTAYAANAAMKKMVSKQLLRNMDNAKEKAEFKKELEESMKDTNASPLLNVFFGDSKQLSCLKDHGCIEPLLPFRHPDFCSKKRQPTMNYIVEDFGHTCRHTLTKQSKTAFFDIGTDVISSQSAIGMVERYRQFGIPFDDIYAYGSLEDIYDKKHYGTMHKQLNFNHVEDHPANPWTVIKQNFTPEDYVVVKLDINTPTVELSLINQLLEDEKLHDIVDVLYFDQLQNTALHRIVDMEFFHKYVTMPEMKKLWQMKGTITDSMKIFARLRELGIATHYWV